MNNQNGYEPTRHELNLYRWKKIKYLIVCFFGFNRIKYLKKNNVFKLLGDNVTYQPIHLPNYPERIKIHNNVRIAADVTFYEHDIINYVFQTMDKEPYGVFGSCIEIFDNVFVGGKSIIVGGGIHWTKCDNCCWQCSNS